MLLTYECKCAFSLLVLNIHKCNLRKNRTSRCVILWCKKRKRRLSGWVRPSQTEKKTKPFSYDRKAWSEKINQFLAQNDVIKIWHCTAPFWVFLPKRDILIRGSQQKTKSSLYKYKFHSRFIFMNTLRIVYNKPTMLLKKYGCHIQKNF